MPKKPAFSSQNTLDLTFNSTMSLCLAFSYRKCKVLSGSIFLFSFSETEVFGDYIRIVKRHVDTLIESLPVPECDIAWHIYIVLSFIIQFMLICIKINNTNFELQRMLFL